MATKKAVEKVIDEASMNVSNAMSNEETRLVVLSRAMRELRSFQEKYANLTELADVFEAINKVHFEEKEDN